jgi:hypothetical protein
MLDHVSITVPDLWRRGAVLRRGDGRAGVPEVQGACDRWIGYG